MTAAQRRAAAGILTGILAVGVTPGAPAAATRTTAGWGYPFAAATAYTLPTDAGSYVLSGSPTGLLRGYVLPTAAGAYTLTGFPADLRKGLLVDLSSGSYLLTGVAADLITRGALQLTATPGVYLVTGADAVLTLGRILDATTGTYTILGTPTALRQGYTLPAEVGSYLVTGVDVQFVYRRALSLVTVPGVYTIDGRPAALIVAIGPPPSGIAGPGTPSIGDKGTWGEPGHLGGSWG